MLADTGLVRGGTWAGPSPLRPPPAPPAPSLFISPSLPRPSPVPFLLPPALRHSLAPSSLVSFRSLLSSLAPSFPPSLPLFPFVPASLRPSVYRPSHPHPCIGGGGGGNVVLPHHERRQWRVSSARGGHDACRSSSAIAPTSHGWGAATTRELAASRRNVAAAAARGLACLRPARHRRAP
jgi:hypothetical protein